jgi:outer membrane lipoprotein-sorting protein
MRGRVALFVLLAVLAGCMGLGDDESSVPDGEMAEQGYESLVSVEGTIEIRTVGAENDSVTVRSVRRPREGMVRQEFIAPPSRAGDVTVSNGSVTWIYNATTNEATRFTIENGSVPSTNQTTFLRGVFDNLSTSAEGSVIAAPLQPIAPADGDTEGGSTVTGFFGQDTRPVNLTYLGTETIAGREAHGVGLTPINETGDDDTPTDDSGERVTQHIENVTYWFDAEYFHPLRIETTVRVDGEITRSTRVYQNVSFNVDPDPGTFRFDPPANATVRSGPEPTTLNSTAAAAESVSFRVADGDPPERFEFETAVVTRLENRTTVTIQYADGTDILAVSSQRPPFEETEGERVSLGPVTGTRMMSGNAVVITWRCGETGYAVSGRLPPDTIETVARDAAAVCSNESVANIPGGFPESLPPAVLAIGGG